MRMTLRKLTTGYYVPTRHFQEVREHTAVMFDDDQILVACVGRKGDTPDNITESTMYAKLFAASPDLLEAAVTLCAFIESRMSLDGETWLEKQAPALQQAYHRSAAAIQRATGAE